MNEDQLNPRYLEFDLKDKIMLNNPVNVINVPTRVTSTTRTLLDPIVLSEIIKVLDFGIVSVPADVSDHSAKYIFFTI